MSEGYNKGIPYGSIAVVVLGAIAVALQVALFIGMTKTLFP